MDLFDYADYRQFIKDYVLTRQSANRAFSYRYLAMKAGINSSSFYTQIVKGARNLTKNTILRTCQALKLSDSEAEYFEHLVFFNQAGTIRDKNRYFELLTRCRSLHGARRLQPDQYDYFSAWYHCVVREAVVMLDFGDDFKKLAHFLSPAISAEQAKQSVELLLRLGLLVKTEHGYAQADPTLTARSDIRSIQITNFQIEMLKHAIAAFDRCRPEKRIHSATTFGISEENAKVFAGKLRECREQLMNIAQNDPNPQVVYQLNLSLFPMTQPSTNRGRG
jgi:uncharacterized protein (TIGR02147 family)